MVSFSLKLPTMTSFSQNSISKKTNSPPIPVSFLLFFFFHLLFTIPVTSYSPVDRIAVNCGGDSSNIPANDQRNWIGDIGSTLFSLIDPANKTQHIKAEASNVQNIPYAGTARLSRSEFSYSFPVSDGQKFVRLFFYLSSYGDFLLSDSIFSVKAGNHTLLKDFNASLYAGGASDGTISREYCINVDAGQRLINVTFMPNQSHPNAYAFINGIEVVSMPTFLYYTNPDDQNAMMLDGRTQQFAVNNDSALETVYRINVGGSQIPPERDTGMFRFWHQDNAYLESGERLQSISAAFGLNLTYRDYPNYFAPDEVYMTARNYGMKETSKFNVTWEFEVDSVFHYMVRLHFCEFDEQIEKAGDRVFQIFINDALVESFDVMLWTHKQILVPVHRDYAVSMPNSGSFKNLSIKLQPDPTASSYRDVLLNGIEILKISDYNGNLSGSNPDPPQSPPPPTTPSSESSKNRKKAKVISIIVGATSGFIVLSLIVLLIYRRFIRALVREGGSWWGQKSADSSKKNKSHGSSLPSDLCRYFSIDEIRAATSNFDDIFIVGVGGFGNVYKGYIDKGTVPVAIKRLKQGSQQGLHEFQTEIEMLSQLRHNHLVSLIGYCNDGNEMILVYEFMARGTLRDHLYDSENPPLSWKKRLGMCLGAARGLHYLHTGAKHNIIHRDVKSTNILIEEKWVAKVSDFGLSKVGPTGISKSHISTVVKGSLGYLDPEYYKRQRLTEKSDVYSFGVVLLEVLCGRPPLKRNVEKEKSSLVEWVRKCHREGVIHQTVDPLLIESITPECLKAFSDMALKCLVEDGNERPSMNDVVWGLEFALQLQEGKEEEEGLDVAEIEGKSEERALIRKVTRVEESKEGFTSSDESKASRLTTSSSENQSLSSGEIFSELGHPTVR
ncbi:hypothetical protein K1719_042600 [Acacia pycnantha]|nr:hypothetical protein K1719_042600 [Acacia pycnantha]